MNLWNNIRSTLFGFCKDFSAEMAADSPDDPILQVHNFDGFADQNQLPEADMVGLYHWQFDTSGHLVTTSGMFAVSTNNDEGLFRLEKLAGLLLMRLTPDTSIPLKDADTGATIGNLKVKSDVSLSPAVRASQRPMKFIHLELACDLTA